MEALGALAVALLSNSLSKPFGTFFAGKLGQFTGDSYSKFLCVNMLAPRTVAGAEICEGAGANWHCVGILVLREKRL